MFLSNAKMALGTMLALAGCFSVAQVAQAQTDVMQGNHRLAQVNQPQREAVPRLNTTEVRGQIENISGDQIQVRTTTGELVSYTITEDQQGLYELNVGDDIVLLVRESTVIAINPPITPADPDATVTTGATGTSTTGTIGTSTTETTQSEISRESVTQTQESQRSVDRTQPSVTQQPQPAPATQSEPVRALW